jgi:hypothetical protein
MKFEVATVAALLLVGGGVNAFAPGLNNIHHVRQQTVASDVALRMSAAEEEVQPTTKSSKRKVALQVCRCTSTVNRRGNQCC